MIIDYSYSTLQQFPLYQGLGNAWTFNGAGAAAPSSTLVGTWSRMLTLKAQGRIELKAPGRIEVKG